MAIVNLTTGLSGLQVSQRALEIVGQNLANADNPDYHRQDPTLAASVPTDQFGLELGSGVDITSIDRARDQLVE